MDSLMPSRAIVHPPWCTIASPCDASAKVRMWFEIPKCHLVKACPEPLLRYSSNPCASSNLRKRPHGRLRSGSSAGRSTNRRGK
jgi:hypothetical protein